MEASSSQEDRVLLDKLLQIFCLRDRSLKTPDGLVHQALSTLRIRLTPSNRTGLKARGTGHVSAAEFFLTPGTVLPRFLAGTILSLTGTRKIFHRIMGSAEP